MQLAKKFALTAFIAAVALSATPAEAQKVRWKLHSAWGSSVPHLGTSAVRYSETVERMTGGDFKLKFFEPGALIPANEGFDATSKGSIEAAWTTAGYDVGKYPALAFFTAVPFGPSMGEYFAWKKFGGGDELEQEIYGQHNVKKIDCFAIGPETSGWFKNEITDLEQMRGLKMRFFGLGARVMQKLGVSTQLLAGGDIFPALEKGVIDATEFSMPAMDIKYGFYQIAKFNYFPGWHQQVSVSHLLVNMDKWNALPEKYQAILEVACGDSIHHTFAETEYVNPSAMLEMGEKYGVATKRWTDAQLASFEKAWLEVLEEDSKSDPLFKKVADSYLAFRKLYAKWGNAQSLKPTYLD
ncbi:ABC transporter substrate-binding protein [Thalassobaculum fulvum]|jgi:TRAP-type mannitol/chloroaromatic compound transport system substrate-binding protein|uniref:ABC transporter substrate-binding protein n=1 Tax=Thalassobaculum fulvum TaxID=1633335 RepID=A0A918XR89_9PROT|nr:TRAP transporter substrate-binding protein [Thalassobaculum fulvum]GHD46359.1 ABC transporter substrate-binding protein [Thalassobaculum fulvum]